jgi:hypothetical protein
MGLFALPEPASFGAFSEVQQVSKVLPPAIAKDAKVKNVKPPPPPRGQRNSFRRNLASALTFRRPSAQSVGSEEISLPVLG